jgi:hypothetical protein
MEYNEELEKAEKDLQITLNEERELERERAKLARMNISYPDLLIRFAAGFYFVIGLLAPIYFLYFFVMKLLGVDVSNYTLLLILLFGMVSVGTGFGLQRVLELSEKTKNNDNNASKRTS